MSDSNDKKELKKKFIGQFMILVGNFIKLWEEKKALTTENNAKNFIKLWKEKKALKKENEALQTEITKLARENTALKGSLKFHDMFGNLHYLLVYLLINPENTQPMLNLLKLLNERFLTGCMGESWHKIVNSLPPLLEQYKRNPEKNSDFLNTVDPKILMPALTDILDRVNENPEGIKDFLNTVDKNFLITLTQDNKLANILYHFNKNPEGIKDFLTTVDKDFLITLTQDNKLANVLYHFNKNPEGIKDFLTTVDKDFLITMMKYNRLAKVLEEFNKNPEKILQFLSIINTEALITGIENDTLITILKKFNREPDENLDSIIKMYATMFPKKQELSDKKRLFKGNEYESTKEINVFIKSNKQSPTNSSKIDNGDKKIPRISSLIAKIKKINKMELEIKSRYQNVKPSMEKIEKYK